MELSSPDHPEAAADSKDPSPTSPSIRSSTKQKDRGLRAIPIDRPRVAMQGLYDEIAHHAPASNSNPPPVYAAAPRRAHARDQQVPRPSQAGAAHLRHTPEPVGSGARPRNNPGPLPYPLLGQSVLPAHCGTEAKLRHLAASRGLI